MAMIKIATKSSSTANAIKKIRMRLGRLRPNRAIKPSAKAISVAVGIGHPLGALDPATSK